MKRVACIFIGIVAAFGSLEASALAAAIQLVKSNSGKNYVHISGRVVPQDERTFADVAAASGADAVILDSPGGSVNSALEIGRLIRSRGMKTVITRNNYCASACALIWVAGARRILAPGARVGFHATFTTKNSQRSESGVGNALIGRYLTLLDLPERAIVFATTAGPDNLNWLDADNNRAAGIDLEIVESDEIKQAAVAATSRAPVMAGTLLNMESEQLALHSK
ncbi:COG3904 family protein [Sandarakinorhabdus rubra]|uniref:COG3904 family protein n=1 Tax=Sandarakinorhabdus rubra TaxID=2672568 RepID=UPI0013DD025D|nr:hypothetical protein [Sandarakinorhabdus rubra]